LVRVTVSARALRDIGRLEEWLLARAGESHAQQLGRLLLEGIEGLSIFPEKGRPASNGSREIIISHGRSRYVVRYVVQNEDVVVTKVRSGRELG
jgi:plasmid stabilization system protein ParE